MPPAFDKELEASFLLLHQISTAADFLNFKLFLGLESPSGRRFWSSNGRRLKFDFMTNDLNFGDDDLWLNPGKIRGRNHRDKDELFDLRSLVGLDSVDDNEETDCDEKTSDVGGDVKINVHDVAETGPVLKTPTPVEDSQEDAEVTNVDFTLNPETVPTKESETVTLDGNVINPSEFVNQELVVINPFDDFDPASPEENVGEDNQEICSPPREEALGVAGFVVEETPDTSTNPAGEARPCEKCGLDFASKLSRSVHAVYCGEVDAEKENLDAILKTHDENEKNSRPKLRCEKCGEDSSSKLAGILHSIYCGRNETERGRLKDIFEKGTRVVEPEPRRVFRCEKCDKILKSKRGYAGHTRKCGIEATGESEAGRDESPKEGQINVEGKSKSASFRCQVCREVFDSREKRIKHYRVIHCTCQLCGKTFHCSTALKKHLSFVHERRQKFRCPTCSKTFTQKGTVNIHHKLMHGSKNEAFIESVEVELEDPAKGCDVEEKLGENGDYDAAFYKNFPRCRPTSQLKNVRLDCGICGSIFTTREKRLTHYKQEHATCPNCGKSFYTRSEMDRHVKAVHVKARFPCPKCGKTFSQKSSIKLHDQLVHERKNDHVCPECGKTFPSFGNLNSHRRWSHLNERKHPCHLCSKRFFNHNRLKKHFNTVHAKLRNYPCPECPKSFGSPELVRNHRRFLHCQNRPFSCLLCEKSFKVPAHLRRHQLTHQ